MKDRFQKQFARLTKAYNNNLDIKLNYRRQIEALKTQNYKNADENAEMKEKIGKQEAYLEEIEAQNA